MTYTQSDWGEVAELLQPTPERLATAKAWLIEQLNEREFVSAGIAGEYVSVLGIPSPYNNSALDPRDPVNQEQVLAYWKPWLDVRYALHELSQQGFVIATVRGVNPALPESVWNWDGPRVALGQPGQAVTESEFPTVPLLGEYCWSVAESAQRSARLELYDADLFMRKAELAVFDERVRRCVEEGLACYRADLFLAAANMLGAASEAAWHQLAERILTAGLGSAKLSDELGKDNPSIARMQQYALHDLREMGSGFESRFGFARSALLSVEGVARFWRDLRNYGMHPSGGLAPETFSQASLSVQIMGASSYLGRLASLMRGLGK